MVWQPIRDKGIRDHDRVHARHRAPRRSGRRGRTSGHRGPSCPGASARPALEAEAPAGISYESPNPATTSRCNSTRSSSIRPRRKRELCGEHEPDRDGFAVAQVPPVDPVTNADGLEGVAEGVAVVEDRAAPDSRLVCRHDSSPSERRNAPPARRSGAPGVRCPAGRHPRRRTWPSRRGPDAISRGVEAGEGVGVADHADGCQKAPARFLPSGRFTPVLPPIAASTWARSVVGTFT